METDQYLRATRVVGRNLFTQVRTAETPQELLTILERTEPRMAMSEALQVGFAVGLCSSTSGSTP